MSDATMPDRLPAWRVQHLTRRGATSILAQAGTTGALDRPPQRCNKDRAHEPPAPGCSCGLYAVADVGDLWPLLAATESKVEWGLTLTDPSDPEYRGAREGRMVVCEGYAEDPTDDVPILAGADYGADLVSVEMPDGRLVDRLGHDPGSTIRCARFRTERVIISAPPLRGRDGHDRDTDRLIRLCVPAKVSVVVVRGDPHAGLSWALDDWLRDGRPATREWWDER